MSPGAGWGRRLLLDFASHRAPPAKPCTGGGHGDGPSTWAAWVQPARGAVSRSSRSSPSIASSRELPHIEGEGWSEPQTAGRSGRPKSRQRSPSSNCTQGTPAGFPSGIPGMGLEMEGAVQQAPQPGRQVMSDCPGASLSS